MATRTSSVTRVSGLLAVAAVMSAGGLLSGCTPKPTGPEPTAQAFFAALANGDTGAAADLSDKPADARAALNEAWAGLQATGIDAQILSSKYAEDTGSVTYRYTWHLPKNRTWTYDGQLNMIRDEGKWEVRWSATGLHPNLGENQTLALRADPPRRASVNERGGTDVLVPGFLYHYALDAKTAADQLMPTARPSPTRCGRSTTPSTRSDSPSRPARRSEHWTSSRCGRPTASGSRRRSPTCPASSSPRRPNCCPPMSASPPRSSTRSRSPSSTSSTARRAGASSASTRTAPTSTCSTRYPRRPAPSVTISLDRAVQDAAQDAVDMVGRKAMIVAIKPSTGEILAVAQNAAADADGPAATTGLYPPGSTFKIVTAGAAIDRDMATPNTLLGCPGTVDIGQRTIPNYGGFDLGTVPMSRAFASSCNTTFAELASRMPPKGLTTAAAQYGIGPDYKIDGITTRDGLRTPDGRPRRTHRGRLRTGQGAGQLRSAWRWSPRPSRRAKPLCRN